MNIALGVAFIWAGAAMLYLASHGLSVSTPWGAFQSVLANMDDTSAAPAVP